MTNRSSDPNRQPTGVLPSRRRDDRVEGDAVEPRDVLARLRTVGVSVWREPMDGGRDPEHVGPAAEDFHDAFEVGVDAHHLRAGDVDGIALAAIQGLADRLDDREETIERQGHLIRRLRDDVEEQRDDIETLRERIESQQATLSRLRRDLADRE